MKLFLFAIGGTGSRVIRSLTMQLATGIDGLYNTEIVPLVIDYDTSNGDTNRAIKALSTYSSIHSKLYATGIRNGQTYTDHFFMTPISSLNTMGTHIACNMEEFQMKFGAAGITDKFKDELGLDNMNTNAALNETEKLIRSLYNDSPSTTAFAELELDLAKGFKGNPNIGSVVFHSIKDTPEFKQFEQSYNAANGDKVFIISSIFGGTGASGFPELVNAIRSSQSATNVNNAPIGAVVMLPYFSLQAMGIDAAAAGDTGAIDAASFNAKARAALGFYAGGLNNQVNAMYYVGDTVHDQYVYNEGTDRQQNDAHIVEFIAASAVIDFLTNQNAITHSQHLPFEFAVIDDKQGSSMNCLDFHGNFQQLILKDLSVFAASARYYRDVLCGDREVIRNNETFYINFDLNRRIGKGVFADFEQFLAAKTENDWGFYPWLLELNNHAHSLHPFNMTTQNPPISKDDLRHIFTHKVIQASGWGSNPIKDSEVVSAMNEMSQHDATFADANFFYYLRKVMQNKINI